MKKPSNDEIPTPRWVAQEMVEYFNPTGKILDPCSGLEGEKVFVEALNNLPPQERTNHISVNECEIREGKDFLEWKEPVNWIISNPPYSIFRKFLLHAIEVSDNVVFLIPVWKLFLAYGTQRAMYQQGGVREIRYYGTGSKVGFPMGNAIGAIHWRKGYMDEPMYVSFYEG